MKNTVCSFISQSTCILIEMLDAVKQSLETIDTS